MSGTVPDYGPEILRQLESLHGDMGGVKAEVAGLRRDHDRAREESSDRYDAAVGRLETRLTELSEKSDAREAKSLGELAELRALVKRCPHHIEPDVPEVRLRRKPEDSGEMRQARRGLLKSLAALLTAATVALSGWWASRGE